MGDPVQDNLPCGRLRPLNCILLRVAVQENVQFRHLGDPTAIEFAIQLNCELHSHSLARTPDGGCDPAGDAISQKGTYGAQAPESGQFPSGA